MKQIKWLLNWLHLLIHVRQIAIQLDECLKTLGQMHHSQHEAGVMQMKTEKRSKLISNGYAALPPRKWR